MPQNRLILETPLIGRSCFFCANISQGADISKGTEILLVEDSKFIRVAVQRALTGAGYIVHTASDGEAGLLAARKTLPDLVILDLVLPKTSGLEVLRALKQDASTQNIPVVVLAALSEPNKEELLNEGVAACVEKLEKVFEGDSAALIRTVEQVVGKAKALERIKNLSGNRLS